MIKRTAASPQSATRKALRTLLEKMPVGHVDKVSPVWISQSAPLLERCAFRVVAASVRKSFKELEELVEDARKILTDPKRESKRLTGSKADQDEFFDWIDSGMPPEA